MLNLKIKPVAMAVIAATTLTSGMVSYAQANTNPGVMENVTFGTGKAISPKEESIISSAATKTLRHIAQARSDIHDKDLAAAQKELDKANTLLDIIQTSMPTTKIKDRIWVAKKHLEYENTREVMPDLVPIYTSLEELMDYMPVKDAKSHLDKAKEHIKNGNKKPATEELEAMDAALVYNEADLPLAATRQLVASAKAELEKGNADVANTALKNAEDNVVFLSVGVDEPLVGAKASLWKASQDYAVGTYDKARTELKQAIDDLQEAAKSTDSFVHGEVTKLLATAKSLAGKIDKHEDSFGRNLDQLWSRTAALSERAVDYVSTGWSRLRADDAVKSNLIEAKLYLNYADIDQFMAKDDTRANNDLEQALKYVAKAAAQVDKSKMTTPDIKRDIDTLYRSTKKLAKTPFAKRDEVKLAGMTGKISQVIQQL